MAIDQTTRQAAEAKLRLGASVKDVAEQLNIKVPTVYTIKQKLDKTKDEETIHALHEIPTEIITHVVEEAKVDATPAVKKELELVVSGAEGLKKLDMAFQTTITKVLNSFNLILEDKNTPLKDLKMIIDTSASAHEKIFSSGTNIHIGDNNSQSNTQLSVFKNKMGV